MRRGRGGYTLVALLVAMTVASILIAAVLPLASAQAQRDREAELVFRGLQYAEGIRIFRRRFGRIQNASRRKNQRIVQISGWLRASPGSSG